jgi:tyrosinase
MYVHFFEKIIINILPDLVVAPEIAPPDWALPYWNYSSSATAALLPEAFRSPTLPAGFLDNPPGLEPRRNYLWVAERNGLAGPNQDQPFLTTPTSVAGPNDTNLDCLKAQRFNAFEGPHIHHHDQGSAGLLENTPHNNVHVKLGGTNGFMTSPITAALDPMFWLHHCNIDRLWEVWVQRQKQLKRLDRNPKVAGGDPSGWLDVPFDFHDATGAPVQMKPRDVLNTRVPPLSYEYEDTIDPFKGAP